MARAGIAKITKTLQNIRYIRRLHERSSSSSCRLHNQGVKLHQGSATSAVRDHDQGPKESPSCWVPDNRTGIYYPQGHERVMNDIPEGAASFGDTTFWLRNIDGVDKPDTV